MSRTRPSRQQPSLQIAGRLAPSGWTRVPFQKTELWAELTRQRRLLLVSSKSSLTTDAEFEACPDPTDQASVDREKGLVMLAKVRTIAKLRRIERALQLICTSDYGRCRRCREDIPYERLKVQPDALLCVPCLSLSEKDTMQH